MEPIGAFLDEEWGNLSRIFSSHDADFMLHLHDQDLNAKNNDLGSSFSPHEADHMLNMPKVNDQSLFCYSDVVSTNFCHYSQESYSSASGSSNGFYPFPSNEFEQIDHANLLQAENSSPESMDFYLMSSAHCNSLSTSDLLDDMMKDIVGLKEEIESNKLDNAENQQPETIFDSNQEMQLMERTDLAECQNGTGDVHDTCTDNSSAVPRKRTRIPKDAQKRKRNAPSKSRKKQKISQNSVDEEENNAGQNGQSSPCSSSEDDSTSSQELNGGTTSDSKASALNSNGKTRASRGAATDPQSLYARRRRERINERLRILQNLVPNGTKVDISTMLEEAVHYVKFLQLQIKLLSSDELWMYAPIAYNGMDIGMYRKLLPTLL